MIFACNIVFHEIVELSKTNSNIISCKPTIAHKIARGVCEIVNTRSLFGRQVQKHLFPIDKGTDFSSHFAVCE